ncbi:MAG: 50S ribosomal protein L3 [Verrucomicrobiota bacterium]|nr:50S ribosomal protein L3 [Verrucomicrobiota bacterium]
MQGLIGKKAGMTQVYDAHGNRQAVTVIQAGPCVVVQRKIKATDGYDAVQVGFDEVKESRVSKPAAGHFKKVGAAPRRVLREFCLDAGEDLKPGDMVTVATFDKVSHVHVTGMTKGRGFQGVVKRHGMSGGPAAHGSMSHRRPGAIGQRAKPGRINKGHRMSGHMGHVKRTHRNLRVIGIRVEDGAILVGGCIPGPTGGTVVILKSNKKADKAA